jgi:hypothetical protein
MWTRLPCENGQHIASCSFVYLPPPPADPRTQLLAEADRFMRRLFRVDLTEPLSHFLPDLLYKDAITLYANLSEYHKRPHPEQSCEQTWTPRSGLGFEIP